MPENKVIQKQKRSGLWTTSFLILVLGSIISFAGGTITDMVFSLMILELSDSAFLYSVTLALSNFVSIVVPLFAGRWIEKKHKERLVYSFDFLSAFLYFVFGLLALNDLVPPGVILLIVAVDSTLVTVYSLAYESLLPAMVRKEDFTRAYSVVSVLSNVCEASGLLGFFAYYYFGSPAVLFFCSACFFVSAICETRIRPLYDTAAADIPARENVVKTFLNDCRDVFRMIKSRTGFPELTVCRFADDFRTGAFWAMVLPFLEDLYPFHTVFGFSVNREYVYIIILAFYSIGQFWSGVLSYRLNMKGKTQYFVLVLASLTECAGLSVFAYLGVAGSSAVVFVAGIASIFSQCAYDTVIYGQVPSDIRSRFLGIFTCAGSLFSIFGNLVGGWMMERLPVPELAFLLSAVPEGIAMALAVFPFRKKLLSFYRLPADGGEEEDCE